MQTVELAGPRSWPAVGLRACGVGVVQGCLSPVASHFAPTVRSALEAPPSVFPTAQACACAYPSLSEASPYHSCKYLAIGDALERGAVERTVCEDRLGAWTPPTDTWRGGCAGGVARDDSIVPILSTRTSPPHVHPRPPKTGRAYPLHTTVRKFLPTVDRLQGS